MSADPRGHAGSIATIELSGLDVACCDHGELLDALFRDISERTGGWLMTMNVDLAAQGARDTEIRALQRTASVIVADGMPLVWAARLRGTPLPARIAGSDLVFLLAERCAREDRGLFLLGGEPAAGQLAAAELVSRWPTLRIADVHDPRVDTEPSPDQCAEISARITRTQPAIVLVALGSPKTEHLIHALRGSAPGVWWVGVGIGLGFAAGQVRRAPHWMRRIGAEWLHRLSQEPGRLAKRYLVDNLGFALRLLAKALGDRVRSR